MDEARDFIKDVHLDKDFMTTTFKESGGAYYNCMYSGKNTRRSKVKAKGQEADSEEEKKANLVAKMGETCEARIRIRSRRIPEGEKGKFRLNGCLTHNHEILPRKQRIPLRVRDTVLQMLMNGISTSDILKYKFESPFIVDDYPTSRVFLHRGAVESIKRKLPKDFEMPKVVPATTITISSSTIEGQQGPDEGYLLWHTVVGFNLPHYAFDSPLLSEELRCKFLHTQGFLAVMFMSEEQNGRFSKYPHTLILDVTQLEKGQCPYQIVTGCVVDSKSESSPIFQVIVEAPRIEIFSAVLTRLKAINPEASSRLRYLCCRMMEPKVANEILADSKNVFGDNLQPIFTIKQFVQSLKQDFKAPDVSAAIQALRHEADPMEFQALLNKFHADHGAKEDGRRFLAEYGHDGASIPANFWATAYGAVMLPANIGIKHYKTEITRILKSSSDIELGLLPKLIDLDTKYARAEEVKVLEVGSFAGKNKRSFFVAFEALHQDPKDFNVFLRPDGSISISSKSETGENIVVRSGAPVCNEPLCQTRCRSCPSGSLCVHAFQCTCAKFADERICCHLHVAISVYFVGDEADEDPLTLHRRIVAPSTELEAPHKKEAEKQISLLEERRKCAVDSIKKLSAFVKSASEGQEANLERIALIVDQLCTELN